MTTISNDANLCIIFNKLSNSGQCQTKCAELLAAQKAIDSVSGVYSIVCYSPKNASGVVSMTKTPTVTKKTVTTDQNLVTIPTNAIIDRIDFFGINNFTTKGVFSIGLGQLNDTPLMPLIENSDATIALDKSGGSREFPSTAANGKNAKNLVLFQSFVNLTLEHPVTSGSLQVVIQYRLKPTI